MKRYDEYGVNDSAAMILGEIVKHGTSKGWGGSISMLEQVKEKLGKFNVFYANDFFGEWRLKD